MFPVLQQKFFNKPVNLDITHRCPLLCEACYRQTSAYIKNAYLHKEMPSKDLKKFIDSGFTYLEFSGQQSDPMAHPDILNFISICQDIKLDIHTATSHKKKNFYREAFDRSGSETTWIFGLDGLPEESHIHRINQNGIHLYEMMKLGVEMDVSVKWQYIVFNYNQDHIDIAREMAENDGIEFKLALSSRWGPGESSVLHLKPTEEYCA